MEISREAGGQGRLTAYAEAVPAGSDPTGAAGAQATTAYYLADHLGTAGIWNSRRAAGRSGRGNYLFPFGQEINPQVTTNNYKFTGQERDSESGLDHFTFRTYNSGMGRWASPDPYDGSYDLTDPQSFNRYSYVESFPLSDPGPTRD